MSTLVPSFLSHLLLARCDINRGSTFRPFVRSFVRPSVRPSVRPQFASSLGINFISLQQW